MAINTWCRVALDVRVILNEGGRHSKCQQWLAAPPPGTQALPDTEFILSPLDILKAVPACGQLGWH